VTGVVFDPMNEKLFLSVCLDDKMRLWNLPQKNVETWKDTKTMLTAAAISPDGLIS
jgi:WD repeat-containing protein 44